MRFYYLEGIRGLCAASIVLHHFFLLLYGPMIPKGYTDQGVCVFFVLSGFILSAKYFRTGEKDSLSSAAIRRYLRLTAPAFCSILITAVFMRLGFFYYHECRGITQTPLDVFHGEYGFTYAIREGLWGQYFTFDFGTSFNPALWTMSFELFGSFLVFSFLALFGDMRRWVLYIIALLIFGKGYYLAFILGMILSDITFSRLKMEFPKGKLHVLWLPLAVYLMFYTEGHPLYTQLHLPLMDRAGIAPNVFFHILGATALIWGVLTNPFLQKILALPPLVKLGGHSFSLYLIHDIILSSFGGGTLLFLLGKDISYPVALSGAALVSLPFLTLFTVGLSRVDRYSKDMGRKFEAWMKQGGGEN